MTGTNLIRLDETWGEEILPGWCLTNHWTADGYWQSAVWLLVTFFFSLIFVSPAHHSSTFSLNISMPGSGVWRLKAILIFSVVYPMVGFQQIGNDRNLVTSYTSVICLIIVHTDIFFMGIKHHLVFAYCKQTDKQLFSL